MTVQELIDYLSTFPQNVHVTIQATNHDGYPTLFCEVQKSPHTFANFVPLLVAGDEHDLMPQMGRNGHHQKGEATINLFPETKGVAVLYSEFCDLVPGFAKAVNKRMECDQRFGQAVFNTAESFFGTWAFAGTPCDPFYDNSRVDDFVTRLMEVLTNPAY